MRAQTLDRIDPIETAFAGSTTARSGDARLAWRNPASLGRLAGKRNIVASFAPSVLGIDGYREGSCIFAMNVGKHLSIGLSGAGLGAGDYQEFSGSVAAAGSVGDDLRLGFTLTAQSTSIRDYGSQVVPLIDLGMQIDVAEAIALGASFVNATRTTVADEDIPQRLAIGMACTPDSSITLSMDAVQELRRDLGFAFGVSYNPAAGVTLRTGLSTEPRTVGYGVGYRLGDVTIDYGGAYVDPLGFNHVFGVGVVW